MKRTLSILFSFLFVILLFSCGETPSSNNEEPEPEPTPNPVDAKGNVIIDNNSAYAVNVYIGNSPYYKVAPNCTVSEKSKMSIEIAPSEDPEGHVFYLEYLIPIGNARFPYWNIESASCAKYLVVEKNKNTTLYIDEISECKSTSAYFLVENTSDSSIYLVNGMSIIQTEGKEVMIEAKGGSGTFELNGSTTFTPITNVDKLQVLMGSQSIPFGLKNDFVERGNIYTFSFDGTQVSLKSITPFNVDTQKKIWTRTTLQSTDLSISAVRPKKDVSKGYLAVFSSKKQPNAILMKDIDVYGNTLDTYSAGFLLSNENPYDLKELSMIDFIEAADGSSVILGSAYCEKKDDNSDWYIDDYFMKYDFATRNFSFQKNISQYIRENVEFELNETKYKNPFTYFSPDRQNTLIEYEDNKYALSGCAYLKIKDEDDTFNYYYYSLLILLDSENSSEPIEKIYVSNQPSTNLEQVASSIFYNKKDSCFYVTEYYDWDSGYNSSIPYKSRLLKFDSNLENKTVVLDEENMLFLGITGDSSTGKYYITGENYSTSGQKGVLISSSNVTAGEKLKSTDYCLYFAKGYSYAWFNQVCICGNNIVACGAASSKPDAEELPIVVAFNSKGELQWQNTDYSGYTSAKSCFATSIGTYLVNLVKTEDSEIKACAIVSADLLGKATGNVAVLQ